MPVMEGKASSSSTWAASTAVPICLDTKDPDEIIKTVSWLQPVLRRHQPRGHLPAQVLPHSRHAARRSARSPCGTTTSRARRAVTLAGLINALKVVGKRIDEVEIAMVGSGAANVAISRLIFASGADPAKCIIVRQQGHPAPGPRRHRAPQGRSASTSGKFCQHHQRRAAPAASTEALRGADVCIAPGKPGPDTIDKEWIRGMANDAIVFPAPTRSPRSGRGRPRRPAPRVVATGRSRLPQPGQQLARLPGHLPRHPRRARQDDHRRDVHRRRPGAGQGRRGQGPVARTTSCRPWTTGRSSRVRPWRWP